MWHDAIGIIAVCHFGGNGSHDHAVVCPRNGADIGLKRFIISPILFGIGSVERRHSSTIFLERLRNGLEGGVAEEIRLHGDETTGTDEGLNIAVRLGVIDERGNAECRDSV